MRFKWLAYSLIMSFIFVETAIADKSENYVEKFENTLLDEYKDNPYVEDNRFYLSYDIKDVFRQDRDYSIIPIPVLNAFNRTNSEILNEQPAVKKIKYRLDKYFDHRLDIEITNKKMSVYKGRPQADLSYNTIDTITPDNEKLRVNIGMEIIPEVKIYSDDVLLVQPYFRINLENFKIETSYNLLGHEAVATIMSKQTGLFLNYTQNSKRSLVYTAYIRDVSSILKIKILTEYDLINLEERSFIILYRPFNK